MGHNELGNTTWQVNAMRKGGKLTDAWKQKKLESLKWSEEIYLSVRLGISKEGSWRKQICKGTWHFLPTRSKQLPCFILAIFFCPSAQALLVHRSHLPQSKPYHPGRFSHAVSTRHVACVLKVTTIISTWMLLSQILLALRRPESNPNTDAISFILHWPAIS